MRMHAHILEQATTKELANTILTLQHKLIEVQEENDLLVWALTKIKEGSELGTFLQNVELPWAVCKDLDEMENVLAKVEKTQ